MAYKHLRIEEREIIATMNANGSSEADIAKALGRPECTINREFKRNGPKCGYSASVAQGVSDRRWAKAARGRRKMEQPEIRAAVKEKLKEGWSPEQIEGATKRRCADNRRCWISRQTIYNSIERDDHGLPLKKLLRRYRLRKRGREKQERTCPQLEHRPAIINKRGRCGDWEADLICSGGGDRTALISLVERKTGYTELILVSNKTSELVMSKIRGRLEKCPRGLRLSITFDNGSEFARWQWLRDLLHVEIYFAHPHSPWERGTNENTNGLVRQYFPKGTRFSQVNKYQGQDVQDKLNHRPRKRLGFQTPHEAFQEQCCLALQG